MCPLRWKRAHLTAKQKVSAYKKIWIAIYDSTNSKIQWQTSFKTFEWNYNYYLFLTTPILLYEKRSKKISLEFSVTLAIGRYTFVMCNLRMISAWNTSNNQISFCCFFLHFLRLFKHSTAVRFVWNCPGFSKGTLYQPFFLAISYFKLRNIVYHVL